MGSTRSQPVSFEGVNYPSKSAAAIALGARGMKPADIAEITGSTAMAVTQAIKEHRRKAAKSDPATHPELWTPEKRDKVRRLFGTTMVYIAEAVQVPPAELLTYVLHGVIPPSQAVRNPDDIRWVPPSAMPQLPAPEVPTHCSVCAQPFVDEYLLCGMVEGAWCRECFSNSKCCLAHGDDCSTVVAIVPPAPIGEPDHVDADDLVVDLDAEPNRDDDEAELAALASQEPDWEDEDVPYGVDPATAATIVSTIKPSAKEEPALTPARFQATAPAPARPMAAASSATSFRLIDETGRYLHESLDGMTTNPRYAWKGDSEKLKVLQKRLPHIRQLDAVPA